MANWITRGEMSLSAPYRVTRSIRGFECWIYSKAQSGCLAREVATLRQAQDLCDRHRQKQKESA